MEIPALVTEEPDFKSVTLETLNQEDRTIAQNIQKSGIQQKSESNTVPKKDDLFATFFTGASAPTMKCAELPKESEPDTLWASLAIGLTEVHKKKTHSKKSKTSGLTSIFKR